jgi:hypothetical protein
LLDGVESAVLCPERVTGIEPAFSAWEAQPRGVGDLQIRAFAQVSVSAAFVASNGVTLNLVP